MADRPTGTPGWTVSPWPGTGPAAADDGDDWHDQRVTPAQQVTPQAQLERRLAWQSPVVGVVLGAALAAAAGHSALVLGLVVLGQALLVSGLHRGLHVTAPVSGMLVAGVLAVVADVAVWQASRPHTLEPIVTVIGVGFLLGVVQQLVRRDDRAGLVPSLAATVSVSALASFTASWLVIALGAEHGALRTAGIALALASLARLVRSDALAPWAALVAGPVAAVLARSLLGSPTLELGRTALLGLAVGLATGLADALVRRGRTSLRARWWTTGALAFAAAAPLGYVALYLTS